MTTVDRSPARISTWTAMLAALVAFGLSGFYSWIALGVGAVALVVVALGLVRGSHRAVTVGGFGLLLGTIVAGVQNAPVVPLLGGLTATVLAWDIGHSAISVGRQLGRSATTIRIEAVHIGTSLTVGVTTIGVGYGIFRIGSADQPLATLVFLLIGAVLLVAVLEY